MTGLGFKVGTEAGIIHFSVVVVLEVLETFSDLYRGTGVGSKGP